MVAELEQDEREIAIRDRVLCEGDVRGRLVSISTVVVRVDAAELWLGVPEPDPTLALLRSEQPVRLTLTDSDAARLAASAFLRTLGTYPPRVFSVRRPTAFDAVQRRVHHRYEIDAPLRVRQIDPLTKEPVGRSAPASAVNVSLGGMLLRTMSPVAVGDEVDVSLPLGGGDHISSAGRVVRIHAVATPGLPGQPFVLEVGTRFTRITAADQDLLMRLAFAADRRRRLAAEALGQFSS